jgi:hypothetical protein
MCRKVLGLLLVMAFLLGDKANATQYAFQITFTDKNSTPFSLTAPASYLSSRAILRRTSQSIAVDSTDLPVITSYIDSAMTLTSGVLHGTSRWFNMCVLLLSDSSQILNLAGKPYISNIKLVGYYATDIHHKTTPNPGVSAITKAAAKTTTGFDATYYGTTWDQTRLVNGNYLHDKGFQGAGKLIAVLDAGFLNYDTNPGFDSLRQSGRMVDSFDFVWRDNNVLRQDSHGAQVLSTMAGNWPGTFVGSAPGAMYAMYLTEYNFQDQPMELFNLLMACERADSIGADIITESLGYDLFDAPAGSGQVFATDLDGKSTLGARAANMATKKGMLFVATAGNDGSPPIPGWGNHILTPGDADSALTIGSTDVTGVPASNSGYGPNAAGQVKPDVSAMGQPAFVLGVSTAEAGSGTSFSTPQIAGWAACLWQANAGATPYQIRQAIIKCASAYASPGAQLGYGVPNFECTEQILNVEDTPTPFTAGKWVMATPNPFNTELTIAVNPEADGYFDFLFTDVTGRAVFSSRKFLFKGYNQPETISMKTLPKGLYFLRVSSMKKQQTIKLVKS